MTIFYLTKGYIMGRSKQAVTLLPPILNITRHTSPALSDVRDLNSLSDFHVTIMDDLQKIYQAAFDSGHYAAALKAKELQLKHQQTHAKTVNSLADELCNLDNQQLKIIINRLEKTKLTPNI